MIRRSDPSLPTDPQVIIDLALSHDDAAALAQFLKRVGFTTYRMHARNDDEAYAMFMAAEDLRRALAAAGYAPR